MAWPYTAVYDTYSAGMEVPSALLNEVQERIVDLHVDVYGDRTICLYEAWSPYDVSGATNCWDIATLTPGDGYVCLSNVGPLYYIYQPMNGAVIKGYDVKYYNSTGSPVIVDIKMYLLDLKFASATTAPAIGSSLSTPTNAVAATSWGVSMETGLTITVPDYKKLLIIVNGAVGDKCAGINLYITPLTKTP